MCLAFLWPGSPAKCQEAQISEYKVKAAFLLNFARFVEWPEKCFASADAPMVIGVLGENPFGGDLEEVVRGKTINEHPIEIKLVRSLSECSNCHLLFVCAKDKRPIGEIVGAMRNASVLTVGETEGFTEKGGIINIVRDGKKFRFQINTEAAKKANLKISSKLLGLAMPGH